MLVLQSCSDSPHILPHSSSESQATSSGGASNFGNIAVENDMVVIEEGFIALNDEADIGIKQEEIPENINFPDTESEPDVVSYVCMSVIRHITSVHHCQLCLLRQCLCPIGAASLFGFRVICCDCFLVGGRDGLGWEVLYWMGLCESSFREFENIFVSPHS
jgi:hypothetical protein